MKPEPVLTLRIGGKEFRGWTNLEVTHSMDTFSSVQITAPFDARNADFRRIFRPFSFQSLEVLADGEPLFTGTLVGVDPGSSSDNSTVALSGYSLPGVLMDSCLPMDRFPASFHGLKLPAIAKQLLEPFGLSAVFDADAGTAFETVRLEPDQTIFDFLVELARQRGLVLSSTAAGELLFQAPADAGIPVARLVDGMPPVLGVSAEFDPQAYFSHITGIGAPSRLKDTSGARRKDVSPAAKYTVANQWLRGPVRHHNFRAEDTATGDLPAAVDAKMGRMFANAAKWSVDLATWRDPQGAIWEANTTLTLAAPNAMIYRESEFLIRGVTLTQDSESSTAVLDLVLPGAFVEQPIELPWEADDAPGDAWRT